METSTCAADIHELSAMTTISLMLVVVGNQQTGVTEADVCV
jgi:hypothetical protein